MHKHIKISLSIFIVSACLFYFLSGVLFNPFILWTSLPLYIGYFLINGSVKSASVQKLVSAYGFIVVSILFSVFYHLTWYLDWQGTQTGSSTSALIFVWMPIYAVILGFVAYFITNLLSKLYVFITNKSH